MEILLWIIFIFLMIGYGFKIFFRYGMPWLLNRFVQNQQKKYANNFSSGFKSQSNDQNVNTETERKSKKDMEAKEGFGEYVDYEEIDE